MVAPFPGGGSFWHLDVNDRFLVQILTSTRMSVVNGSYLLEFGEVYSEERSNPKGKNMAAINM